jgi:hypothetical protein
LERRNIARSFSEGFDVEEGGGGEGREERVLRASFGNEILVNSFFEPLLVEGRASRRGEEGGGGRRRMPGV